MKLLAHGHTDGIWGRSRLASDSHTQYPDDTLTVGGINEGVVAGDGDAISSLVSGYRRGVRKSTLSHQYVSYS